MTNYRVVRTSLIVTKPNGDITRKEAFLYFDQSLKSLGVKFVDGPLKGYCMDVLRGELGRIDYQGVDMPSLPNSLT